LSGANVVQKGDIFQISIVLPFRGVNPLQNAVGNTEGYLPLRLIMRIIFYIILFYLLYRLIFDFIIPVSKATRQIRKNMDHINQQQRQYYQQQQAPPPPRQEPKSTTASDYIDFEEVK